MSLVFDLDRLFRLCVFFPCIKKSTLWSSAEEDELSEVSSEEDEVPDESEGWPLLLRFGRLLPCLGVLEKGGAALPFCIGFLLLRLLLRSEDERGRAVLSLDALLPFLLLRLLMGSGDGDTERLFGRLLLVLLRV